MKAEDCRAGTHVFCPRTGRRGVIASVDYARRTWGGHVELRVKWDVWPPKEPQQTFSCDVEKLK